MIFAHKYPEGAKTAFSKKSVLSGTRTVPKLILCSPWKMLLGFVTVVCLVHLSEVFAASVPRNIAPKFSIPESEQRNWSPYSPYFPLAEYKAPPAGCEINQVRNQPFCPRLCVLTSP